ncbi:STAS domain-containing protein [Nonomuraea sp. NPDC050404]|uniref:STAS domain-containing protein n=1 Tax=Nonomuraea sp. NPDC050404 TaxID=3155783 RepID=UPI0033D3E851
MSGKSDSARRLSVSISLHEGFLVVRAGGDLDYQWADLLHREVHEARETATSAGLILDLGGLTFCDSMGVGVLVLLLNESREQGFSLVLSDVPDRVAQILSISGLLDFFLIEPSVEAAIRAADPLPGAESGSDSL